VLSTSRVAPSASGVRYPRPASAEPMCAALSRPSSAISTSRVVSTRSSRRSRTSAALYGTAVVRVIARCQRAARLARRLTLARPREPTTGSAVSRFAPNACIVRAALRLVKQEVVVGFGSPGRDEDHTWLDHLEPLEQLGDLVASPKVEGCAGALVK